jgi:hypothetical protein
MSPDGALIVPIPLAEPVIVDVRGQLGLTEELELPPHISVLYPFAPPPYDESMLDDLSQCFLSIPRFDFALSSVNSFDWRVIYLSPDPEGPFATLTKSVEGMFPEYPAYGGAFASVIPHLTVVEDESRRIMKRAARRLRAAIPIQATASSVLLVGRASAEAPWTTYREFELAESGYGGTSSGASIEPC